jgi:transcriptional regulator with XRE-family HTH domain
MSIGDQIRLLRQREMLSQDDLAQQLGVTRTAVTHWESQRDSIPSQRNIDKLCRYFKVSHDWLINGKAELEVSDTVLPYSSRSHMIDRITRHLATLNDTTLQALLILLKIDLTQEQIDSQEKQTDAD